uniref:Chaperone protein dnaJ 8 n=1 Tax=Rhizophora mucronata TaxID=61149 RepID=A0A2P2NHM1_RHIMU
MEVFGIGIMGRNGCAGNSSSWFNTINRRQKNMVGCRDKFLCAASFSSSVMDPYKTLMIQPGASESEVKKAFRKLALQYHPDVCRGSNCGVQFNLINDAYDTLMSNLRGEPVEDPTYETYDQGIDEPMRGMDDPEWDMWEEWMGWEGAGIRDYSSHVNPYI